MITLSLVIILILLLVPVIPAWPHSRNYGYTPAGVIFVLLVVVLILALLGYL